ncbi:MAG: ROK family protein [Pleomorphochaeta sp.]
MKQAGYNLSKAKTKNVALVKNTIYRKKSISRHDIAEILKLTPATITMITNVLIESGDICEKSIDSSLVKQRAGRKPVLLEYVKNSSYFIGIENGPYGICFVLTNLLGEIIIKRYNPSIKLILTNQEELNDLLKIINETINEMCKSTKISKSLIKGIGFGTLGEVVKDTGIVHFSNSSYLYSKQNIYNAITEATNIRTYAINNVKARAIAVEMNKIEFSNFSFLYLFASKGVVCPYVYSSFVNSHTLITDGEIGDMTVQADLNNLYNEKGTLKSLANENALLSNCKKLLKENKASILKDILKDRSMDSMTKEDLLLADINGDKDVQKVIYEAIQYLAIAGSNLVNMLNPNELYVDNFMFDNMVNRENFKEILNKKIYSSNYNNTQIKFIKYDLYNGAISAAFSAIKYFYIQGE